MRRDRRFATSSFAACLVATLAGCSTESRARTRNATDPVTSGGQSSCSITCESPAEPHPRRHSIDCPEGMVARCSCATSPYAFCVADPTSG